MRIVLISTYALGHQPFGLASPAAWLRRAGADVVACDVSRQRLDADACAGADLIAFYLPMHTATRLALPLVARLRQTAPRARLCAFGLYAPLNAALLRESGVDHVLGPECEGDLVALARTVAARNGADPSTALGVVPSITIAPSRDDGAVPSSGAVDSGWRGTLRRAQSGADPSTALGIAPSITVAASRGNGAAPRRPVPRLRFLVPDRRGLPPLHRYARLNVDGQRLTAGYTEASRGCKHRCRHCPIVPVYEGRFRAVSRDVVIADLAQQVEAGARHITFGDPDFFNGIGHARAIVSDLARRFPGVTYDVTIKVEHLVRHATDLPLLRDTGCLFVTSAVESIDDEVLARLRKGHTRAAAERAVALCRDSGLALVPTFVPFTPWTTRQAYLELLDWIAEQGLVDHVAPIQLALRLLLTAGTPLLDDPSVAAVSEPFDAARLVYPWRHPDAALDTIQRDLEAMVAGSASEPRALVFAGVRALARERLAGVPMPPLGVVAESVRRRSEVPWLDEPWYC